MTKKSEHLHERRDWRHLLAEMGRRLRNDPAAHDDPSLRNRYTEMSKWLRMQSTVSKWKPVQLAYDKAYRAARSDGKSSKHAHLQAKSEVMHEFPRVNERDLARDTKRGIIAYD